MAALARHNAKGRVPGEPVVSKQPVFREHPYAGEEGGAKLPPRPKGALWHCVWIGIPAFLLVAASAALAAWWIWKRWR